MEISIQPHMKLLALALALGLGTVSVYAQHPPQEYYERETNQHLGSDDSSYYYIHRVVKNGENINDTSDLYTYRDSTFLMRRTLDGKLLLEKTLLRVEHRDLVYTKDNEAHFDTHEDYVIDKKADDLLPDGFTYAKAENPIWPCAFDFRTEGVYLTYKGKEHFLVPVTDFEHLFPEYMYFPVNHVDMKTLDGYSGADGWYYVSVSPDCMTDPVGVCRQVLIPIPEKLMMKARAELLEGVEHKEKE